MATYTCLWRIPFQKTNCELWWNTCIVNTKDTPQVLVEKAKHTQVNQTINTNCWNLHQCNPLSIWYFILPWLSCFHFSKLSVEIHFHISMFLDHHDKFSQCLLVYTADTFWTNGFIYFCSLQFYFKQSYKNERWSNCALWGTPFHY